MANIASLAIQFTARTGGLTKGLSKVNKGVSGMAKKVAAATTLIVKYGAAMVTAGAGALAFFIKQQFTAVDAIAKFSQSMEVSIGALEGYKLAARITGASNELIIKSMQTLQKRMGEVAQGFGEGKRALDALGIEFDSIKDLPLENQLEHIADGMKNLKTRSEQAAVANQLFGRAGKDLLIFLDQGSKGIRGFIDEAKELGLSFSAVDGRKIEDANDAIVRLKSSITGVVRGLAIGVAPVIERIATTIKDKIIELRKSAISLFTEMKDGIVMRLREIIDNGLPFVILFVKSVVSGFVLLTKTVFTLLGFFAKGVFEFFKFLDTFSEVTFGIGLIDGLKELLIVTQFVFKNFKQSIGLALDFATLKFLQFKDKILTIFSQIALNIGEVAVKVFSVFKGIGQAIATKGILTGNVSEADLNALADTFDDIVKPLSNVKPIVSEGAKFFEKEFAKSLGNVSGSFADFRKKELESAGDITNKFLDFFKFKLPKLEMSNKTAETIKSFAEDKTLKALEKGSAEALKVERNQQDVVEKNTSEMVVKLTELTGLTKALVDQNTIGDIEELVIL